MLLLAAALVSVSLRLSCVETTGGTATAPDASEAVINCIMTRTSVRTYSSRPVDKNVMETILRAGMAAPTAANQQAWEFVVITDESLKSRIADSFEYTKMVRDCAFAVVVCGDMDKLFDGDVRKGGFWTLDCAAASENMLLAAHALGLGGVWCGIYPMEDREKTLSAILSLPGNLTPLNILSFGYPAAASTPKDKWHPSNIRYN